MGMFLASMQVGWHCFETLLAYYDTPLSRLSYLQVRTVTLWITFHLFKVLLGIALFITITITITQLL